MTEPATGQRTFLQALKVPFDLKGVLAGAVFYAVALWGGRLMGFDMAMVGEDLATPTEWPALLTRLGGEAPGRLLLALVALLSATLGLCCCRIAGMRIARDEGAGFRESLGFALALLPKSIAAVLFLVVAGAGCAAANGVAGLASDLPAAGPVLMFVLYPLVLLSSLILFLIAFGTLFGLPLVLPALAVERNGALDAVSRAWSYVWSRFVLHAVFLLSLGLVLRVMLEAVRWLQLLVGRTFLLWAGEAGEGFHAAVTRGAGAARVFDMPATAGLAEGTLPACYIAWGWGVLFHLVLMGFVVYYVFGGFTAMYFAHRRDVDGTEEEEIWLASEQGEEFGEPEPPEPAEPAA